MTFGHPLLLLTLLIVPAAIGLFVLAERRRMRYAVRFTNLEVLAGVVGGRGWRRFVPLALFLLALAALCVAVARPHVHRLVPRERATTILVIDASRSMESRDIKPSRLGAAQEAVRTFLERVPKRMRVGLIVFAGDAQVAAPPTASATWTTNRSASIGPWRPFGRTPRLSRMTAPPSTARSRRPGRNLTSWLRCASGSRTTPPQPPANRCWTSTRS